MITNTEITIFHKGIDKTTRLETWTRYYYPDCWCFDVNGSMIRDGYEVNNSIDVRIPYETNENLNLDNFSIGDIICKGNIQKTITSQSELSEAYNITSITNSTYGNNKHIHLRGG